MIDAINQAIIFVFGAASVFLLARDNRWGFVFGLIPQPVWLYLSYESKQWGVLLLCLICSVNWVYGIYRHFWMPKKEGE